MDFFGKEHGGDKDAYFIGKVQNTCLASAKHMIQDKVRGKTEGGLGIQRRAFQMFDRDRNGEVDRAEFIRAIKKVCVPRPPMGVPNSAIPRDLHRRACQAH